MNIINAIINLVSNPILNLTQYYKVNNRANDMGSALEEYIKDLFANSFNCSEAERIEKMKDVFSYLGNNTNPPDAMLREGDAIEIKKIETNNAGIALNSSYPKHTLKATSTMISKACKEAEKWTEKDILYVVGTSDKNKLSQLCMVYGTDYCASEECYLNLRNKIKSGIETIERIDFTESKELGHINRVDPLGITYMRIRGMWGIENPWKVFNYVVNPEKHNFSFMCIINSKKWNTFDNRQDLINLSNEKSNLRISDIKIKNPDNPAKLNDAKLITFSI